MSRRVLYAAAAIMGCAGLALLLTVAYQLFGTNWLESRSQSDLRRQFDSQLSARGSDPPASGGPGSASALSASPSARPRREGEVVAVLRIPRLGKGWEKAVVEGVALRDLQKGPGHYPGTPFFGEAGNVGVAGHRTTWGAPFFHLDRLRRGDLVDVRTTTGSFIYRVLSSELVLPFETSVLRPDPTARLTQPANGSGHYLTLTTCTPVYSASHRLVVHAEQVPADDGPDPARPAALGHGRGLQRQ